MSGSVIHYVKLMTLIMVQGLKKTTSVRIIIAKSEMRH